jgi:hypothetical protein
LWVQLGSLRGHGQHSKRGNIDRRFTSPASRLFQPLEGKGVQTFGTDGLTSPTQGTEAHDVGQGLVDRSEPEGTRHHVTGQAKGGSRTKQVTKGLAVRFQVGVRGRL